ncbi:2Fe-2S ferredoxin like protein [Argiope bruennichi]|uniref:2Fe-2S ferredoxin like protein n=1 Tax=Argiope bruennichi TaxID=94029 RepID=A0A8T0ELP3_ARGBR|nr:2Fe-2S ferredoxin like protein [Argiope bruennichi]
MGDHHFRETRRHPAEKERESRSHDTRSDWSRQPDSNMGACDGTISCSTCHVILSKDDFQKLGKPSDEEDDTLDLSPCLTDTSRLGCCIELTKEMDGIVVKLPAEVKDMRNNN